MDVSRELKRIGLPGRPLNARFNAVAKRARLP